MPIPEFVDGRLPPGIHWATPEEVVSRLCVGSEQRVALKAPLLELISIAQAMGATALYLNGSFVTEKIGPRDIDAVLVHRRSIQSADEHAARLRKLHQVFGFDIERVAEDDEEEQDYLLNTFFGTDRDGIPRGLVGVLL